MDDTETAIDPGAPLPQPAPLMPEPPQGYMSPEPPDVYAEVAKPESERKPPDGTV